MASISLKNVSVDFKLYSVSSMSIRKQIVSSALGGTFLKEKSKVAKVRALNNISFDFVDGDRVGLIGHNGAGKTTLLKTIAGIYKPVNGSVCISNDSSVGTFFGLGVGMDLEHTGLENIIRMGMFSGLSLSESKDLVEDVVEFAELGEFINLPVHTYSSGMLARLNFAVVTAKHPDILLIDEVFGVGDAAFQEKAKKRIDGLIDSVSILLFASHSEQLIDMYCNKKVHMNKGCVEFVD